MNLGMALSEHEMCFYGEGVENITINQNEEQDDMIL